MFSLRLFWQGGGGELVAEELVRGASPDSCLEVSTCPGEDRKVASSESLLEGTMDCSIGTNCIIGPSSSVMVGCNSSAEAISVRGSSLGEVMLESSLSLSVAVGSE